MKKVDAIIVARTGSTRVPGKALFEVAGKPMLQHVIERVKQCKQVGTVCMATTDLVADDAIASLATELNVKVYRGHPEHVLERVYHAAKSINAEHIIEIGGDCPLIDSEILDQAILYYHQSDCDYLNNYNPPTFPEGLDINVLSVSVLTTAFEEAIAPSHRIHPFSYLPDNPDRFKVENYTFRNDLSRFHWSFDFPEDYEFIKSVYEKLYSTNPFFGMRDVLLLIESDDQISLLNKNLMTPAVEHAFWNSPGIIRDLNNDVAHLIQVAATAIENKDFAKANRCYKHIIQVAQELFRFTKSKL